MVSWLLGSFGIYIFIFCARVTDMSLDVIRVLMLTRDRRLLAAVIGFFEVSVFILALNKVLSGGLHDMGKVVAYAGGFATGNFVGSLIENRMAVGYLTLQLFPEAQAMDKFSRALRHAGFGVTAVCCQGRDGDRNMLFVVLKRSDLPRATKLINSIDSDVFFSFSDARHIRGGVFPHSGKKYLQFISGA